MQSPATKQKQRQLTCEHLPLGVYREVAAHLRQVEGVNADLIMRSIEHDETETFDYYQSQISFIQIDYAREILLSDRQRVQEILDYYAQQYYAWNKKDQES